MKPRTLIIGGSSGLGLEIARLLRPDHDVTITGRKDPEENGLQFISLELGNESLSSDLDAFVSSLPQVDLLIYAAGFFSGRNYQRLV